MLLQNHSFKICNFFVAATSSLPLCGFVEEEDLGQLQCLPGKDDSLLLVVGRGETTLTLEGGGSGEEDKHRR